MSGYHLFSQNRMCGEMHEILCQYIEAFSTDDIIQDNSWSAVSVPISSVKKLTRILPRSQLASATLSLKCFMLHGALESGKNQKHFKGPLLCPFSK